MSIQIIGICVIKNEDIYIKNVLDNIIDFCDTILVIDNQSTDETVSIVKKCVNEHSKISLYFLKNINKSHKYVEPFVGKDVWAFGVDGDELYDAVGLRTLRRQILSGEYQKDWMLRGYFFHLIEMDKEKKMGYGYLAPPSKDPNKLYNLKLLKSWKNDKTQPIFHPQTHVFRNSKYYSQHYPPKKKLYNMYNWKDCPLRCVHTRMIKRSSIEQYKTLINARLNMSNIINNKQYNFREKYQMGKKIKIDISMFLKA